MKNALVFVFTRSMDGSVTGEMKFECIFFVFLRIFILFNYVSYFGCSQVSMNSTAGGQTSTNNPRPFKCDDCSVGFRIHGHLAKHLRSKMHIMKLECLGKLPFGTYAEMERCGVNMNDIDTTDCENSLESLQVRLRFGDFRFGSVFNYEFVRYQKIP